MKRLILLFIILVSPELFSQQIPLKQTDGIEGRISSAFGPRLRDANTYDIHEGFDFVDITKNNSGYHPKNSPSVFSKEWLRQTDGIRKK